MEGHNRLSRDWAQLSFLQWMWGGKQGNVDYDYMGRFIYLSITNVTYFNTR